MNNSLDRMKHFLDQRTLALLILIIATICGLSFLQMRSSASGVKFVSVQGEIDNRQRSKIYELLGEVALAEIDLVDLRARIESVSWIANASVERQWPDSLVVTVIPQHAIALWNDDAYINESGRVFHSDFEQGQRLSQLYGPEGSEERVIQHYQKVNNALLKVGQSIETLRLDDRGAWTLTNDVGIKVLLGKDELMERIQRLVSITGHVGLVGRLEDIQQIDTRYSNGVAVGWKQSREGVELAKAFNLQRVQKL